MVEPGMTRDMQPQHCSNTAPTLLSTLVKTYNADIAHISDLELIYAAL